MPLLKTFLLIFAGCIISLSVLADNNSSSDLIAARLKPIGTVNIASPAQMQLTASSAVAKVSVSDGKNIFDTKCSVCHTSGIAGAPKVGDKSAWAPRVAQGIKVLLKHVETGYKAMPPKGTCQTCTETDLEAAIKYMISPGQNKK